MGRGKNGAAQPAANLLYGQVGPRNHARQQKRKAVNLAAEIREVEDYIIDELLAALEPPSGALRHLGHYPLVPSAVLWDPDSPTEKRYQGYIEIGLSTPGPDGIRQGQFFAVTKHGPGGRPHAQSNVEPKGQTRDLDLALKLVNKKLKAKQKGRKGRSVYEPYVPTPDGQIVQITRREVVEAAAQLLKREPPRYSDDLE